jgi:hypothetical protein
MSGAHAKVFLVIRNAIVNIKSVIGCAHTKIILGISQRNLKNE